MKQKALVLLVSAVVIFFVPHKTQCASKKLTKRVVLSAYDKNLRRSASQARSIQIFGVGPLWHQASHLYDGDGAMGPDVATGIQISDRQMIDEMLHCFRCSNDKGPPAQYTAHGSISIFFSKHTPHAWKDTVDYGLEDTLMYATYRRHGSIGYCTDTSNVNTRIMLPGSGQQFEAFIRRMARNARHHRQGVSFFRYIPQTLAPS